MSLPKISLALGIIKLFPARESLVGVSRLGTGKSLTFFTVYTTLIVNLLDPVSSSNRKYKYSADAVVATVLGSIPAFTGTVDIDIDIDIDNLFPKKISTVQCYVEF
jgi:hypothetical protein